MFRYQDPQWIEVPTQEVTDIEFNVLRAFVQAGEKMTSVKARGNWYSAKAECFEKVDPGFVPAPPPEHHGAFLDISLASLLMVGSAATGQVTSTSSSVNVFSTKYEPTAEFAFGMGGYWSSRLSTALLFSYFSAKQSATFKTGTTVLGVGSSSDRYLSAKISTDYLFSDRRATPFIGANVGFSYLMGETTVSGFTGTNESFNGTYQVGGSGLTYGAKFGFLFDLTEALQLRADLEYQLMGLDRASVTRSSSTAFPVGRTVTVTSASRLAFQAGLRLQW